MRNNLLIGGRCHLQWKQITLVFSLLPRQNTLENTLSEGATPLLGGANPLLSRTELLWKDVCSAAGCVNHESHWSCCCSCLILPHWAQQRRPVKLVPREPTMAYSRDHIYRRRPSFALEEEKLLMLVPAAERGQDEDAVRPAPRHPRRKLPSKENSPTSLSWGWSTALGKNNFTGFPPLIPFLFTYISVNSQKQKYQKALPKLTYRSL